MERAEFGALTNNHDTPPAVFQTWNPPGLVEALKGLGYTQRTLTRGYEIAVTDLEPRREQLKRIAEGVTRNTRITTRSFQMRHHRRDAESIRLLNNEAFATSPEVLPYPRDVFDYMFAALRPLLDPELIRFAVRDGEDIGFSLTIPDINQLFLRWNGRLTPWQLARLPWDRRRVDAAVVLLLGVRPDSPMGVSQLLFNDTLAALKAGRYRHVHTTWVHEDNTPMNGLLGRGLELASTRNWVVMAKDLT